MHPPKLPCLLSLSLSHQTCFYVIDIACFLVTTIKFDQVFVLKFGWVLLRYFFLHLILFKYNLFTFKYTYPILFKTQEYLCLAIFEKPMIQIHGNSFIQSPILIGNIKSLILIGNIKTQFLLAISKPNSYWQHQKPNFHWHYFIKKKRAQDYQRLAKKKNIMLKCYCGKKGPWQSSYEETHWEQIGRASCRERV